MYSTLFLRIMPLFAFIAPPASPSLSSAPSSFFVTLSSIGEPAMVGERGAVLPSRRSSLVAEESDAGIVMVATRRQIRIREH